MTEAKTTADPAAPPLLQWDGLPGRPRNPVSWFFYHGGSTPADWGLGYGTCPTVPKGSGNPALNRHDTGVRT